MADKAHLATDELLDKMERRLRAIYTRASSEIGEAWTAYLQESGAEIDDLQRQYQEAKAANDTELARQFGKRLQRAKRERTLMDKRYRDLTQQTAEQLAHVNETATAYINNNLPEVYAMNYNATGEAFDGIGGYSFTLTDADTVRNLVESDRSFLPMRKLDVSRDIAWNIEKMNAEVLQGILQGESMDKIADRLAHVIGMNLRSAISAAQTIVTGAENKGRQDGFERAAAMGIILEREWIATSDGRTRDWHRDLNGVTAAVDEPFENAVGKIMYPGDPSADGANVWNCRCTIAAVVKGFKSAQAQKAMAEMQAEEPNITTREQAYKTLTDDIGFGFVSDNVSVIDEKLLAENVTQLKKLNDRFGVLTPGNSGYFSASNDKGAVAYTQGNFKNLNHQSMSLCESYYGRGYDFLVSKEKGFSSTNWSMPCLDKNLPIYTVTHEYGHLFENKAIRSRIDMDVFEKAYRAKMLESNGAKKSMDFLKKEATKQAKTIWQEITQIAKEKNPDFRISQNISEYGKTNYFEAFAETFANSQCGAPNELGKAMNIWLERNGY